MVIFVICSDDDLIRSGEEDSGDDELFPSDEADESDSNDGMSFFEEEETKSRFTNYSMTSSVLRRNEGTSNFNSLSPKRDPRSIFSQQCIYTPSREELWQRKKWSSKGKFLNLLSNSPYWFFKKYKEISLESLYVDIGA